MLEIRDYIFDDCVDKLNLHFIRYGSAIVDESWRGSEASSVCSRLYYIKKGSFYINMNGARFDFSEGGWYLLPKNSSYTFGCDSETEHLFFHLNLSYDGESDVFENEKSVFYIPKLKSEADKIIQIIHSDNIIDLLDLKNTVQSILLTAIKSYNVNIRVKKYSPCVTKAIEYIKSNLSEALTISKIANEIFVSESTLTKHFKKELSTSVNKYVDDLILSRCAQMITENKISISSISDLFGFCDQFYFSRKFKAKFGKTPSEYKRMWNI